MTIALPDLQSLAEEGDFSGVLRLEQGGEVTGEFCRGFADRANARPNALDTNFAVASATKGLTALTVMSLVESGDLELETTVRSIVGDALPHVDPAVTIDHLLSHRSGVGDYIDEELDGDIDDHVLGNQSVHTLTTPAAYAEILNLHPQKSAPGEKFAYNNSGYVILSIVIETVTGSFHQAVTDRVLTPAGMSSAGFFRSDSLPSNSALGYLQDGRTNILHLPVIGAGDGGIYLTLDDTSALWSSIMPSDGPSSIVSDDSLALMTTVLSQYTDEVSYGRGFWLGDSGDHVWIEGMDAGVSFQSGFIRSTRAGYTVISNTSGGVWPLVKAITKPPGS